MNKVGRRVEGTFSKMENTGDQIWGGELCSIWDMLIWKIAKEVYVVIPPGEQEMQGWSLGEKAAMGL